MLRNFFDMLAMGYKWLRKIYYNNKFHIYIMHTQLPQISLNVLTIHFIFSV
jgi:hypothetical protein